MPDTIAPHALPVSVPLVNERWGILKSLQMSRKNVLRIIPEIAVKQPMVSGKTGKRWHMVMDPGAIRQMLLDKLDQYPKSLVTKNLLKPAIGDSLFIAEGAEWRWQRRTVAPVFTHRNMLNLAPIMTDAAERAADRLAANGEAPIDMAEEMVATTFDVMADVTFSGRDTFDRAAVANAIDGYLEEAGRISLFDMLGAPDWVPRPGRIISGKALRKMKTMADAAIEARAQRGPSDVPDLLDLILGGEDPKSGRKMSTAELRDNLLTFIVAGHETTALTLSWALYLLTFDPAIQEKARAEAQAVLDGRVATGADVEKLPYIRAILDEALRLYPPAAMVSRTAMAPDTLGGREVRTGDTVMIPIYALHRHEMLWDNPNAFVPERWMGEKPDRYAYLPFGDGPRICIGMSFAMQEAVIILATLLARFRFEAIAGKAPDPVMILTLRPQGGVWVKATPA